MSLSSLISVDQMIRQPGDMGRYVAANDPQLNSTPLGPRLDPQADMPKILGDPLRPRSDDPLMQGYGS
jgi:hypothetical protein